MSYASKACFTHSAYRSSLRDIAEHRFEADVLSSNQKLLRLAGRAIVDYMRWLGMRAGDPRGWFVWSDYYAIRELRVSRGARAFSMSELPTEGKWCSVELALKAM